nr:unnamed protein product [Spirometra erinaceieuropaei]
MSFGLRNASQTFQRFADGVIRGLHVFYTNSDGVLIAIPMEHLATVFDRLQQIGLVLNPSKCVFGVSFFEFPERLVDNNGTHRLYSKAAATCELPPLSFEHQLQRFLGMMNFYCQFLPYCTKTILPLTSPLSGPKGPFELSADVLAAFDKPHGLIDAFADERPGIRIVLAVDGHLKHLQINPGTWNDFGRDSSAWRKADETGCQSQMISPPVSNAFQPQHQHPTPSNILSADWSRRASQETTTIQPAASTNAIVVIQPQPPRGPRRPSSPPMIAHLMFLRRRYPRYPHVRHNLRDHYGGDYHRSHLRHG